MFLYRHGICKPVLAPDPNDLAADNVKIELGDVTGIGSASKGTPLAVAVCTPSYLPSMSDVHRRCRAVASNPNLASPLL